MTVHLGPDMDVGRTGRAESGPGATKVLPRRSARRRENGTPTFER